jgi:hypothetical protein
LFNSFKLHKRKVSLHINAEQFSKRPKEHFQVFPPRRGFMKVYHEKCITGSNVASALVFLALDAAIAASKFDAECTGDSRDLAGINEIWKKLDSKIYVVKEGRRKCGVSEGDAVGE